MKLVYVCTPLHPGKFPLGTLTKALTGALAFAFIPPVGQLHHKSEGALLDKEMIEKCDEVWVFGAVGRDCCWEIGYAQGLGKKVVLHIDETNRYLIEEDWMVTLGKVEIVDALHNKQSFTIGNACQSTT
jgi:nucleoside 2-deoxyribosyltransferase